MVDPRIVKFIKRHHVLTLATFSEEGPYCSSAFYCYHADNNIFVFSANDNTRHGMEMANDNRIAASIALETRIVGKIQGVQICGVVAPADQAARRIYISRFPFTAIANLNLWTISPTMIKFTDNTLGFGKKLIWNSKE